MSDAQELIVSNQVASPPSTQLSVDLYSAMMTAPVAFIESQLAEYKDKRIAFRRWLLENMEYGVHYAFPPGCNSNSNDDWKAKPSLYKAGAELVCDLMRWRASYAADPEAWKQLGGSAGKIVIKCSLYSRATGELIADGIGSGVSGEKKMGDNSTLKMAQKRALVCAVLNAQGLSDLFSQDLEDLQPRENPVADEAAPTAPTRNQRREAPQEAPPPAAMCTEAKKLWNFYRSKFSFDSKDKDAAAKASEEFRGIIATVTGRKFDAKVAENWREGEFDKVMAELKMMEGGA
jgi:hypothetical protein